jgi:hypothetical protein
MVFPILLHPANIEGKGMIAINSYSIESHGSKANARGENSFFLNSDFFTVIFSNRYPGQLLLARIIVKCALQTTSIYFHTEWINISILSITLVKWLR